MTSTRQTNRFRLFAFLNILAISRNLQADDELGPLCKHGDCQQDIIVNNEVIKESTRHYDCDTRYKLIQTVLNQYTRPFAVLDIGAREGYYSFRIAHNYQAVCVMVEANSPSNPTIADQLFQLCKANTDLNNIIFLNKMFTAQDLWHLSECEKFDVVLAMNVLDRFGDYWQEPLDAFLHMADNLIVEIKQAQEDENIKSNRCNQAIQKYILEKNGQLLHTEGPIDSLLYWIKTENNYLQRKTWLLPRMKECDYKIVSTFSEKKLIKPSHEQPDTQQITQWIPGINMLTFKMCNGVYPSNETIKKSLYASKDINHTDWMINNMILQGNNIAWIDVQDNGQEQKPLLKPSIESPILLQNHNTLIDLIDAKKIEHYFWYTLIREPITTKQTAALYSFLFSPSSLIFDINSDNEALLEVYLELGARKIICFNLTENDTKQLVQTSKHKNVSIISNLILKSRMSAITIDNMIKLYGRPYMCNIHAQADETLAIIKGLTIPIPCLVFDFNIKSLDCLASTLNYLDQYGYKHFNFSARHIHYFCLDDNPHTGVRKNWAKAHDLIDEIKQFAALDYAGDQLWGHIYAQHKLISAGLR